MVPLKPILKYKANLEPVGTQSVAILIWCDVALMLLTTLRSAKGLGSHELDSLGMDCFKDLHWYVVVTFHVKISQA